MVGQGATGPAVLELVRRLEPDLLFLDVQMPGLDGFEVLARLAPEERPVVVFSTAYDEYALAAFDVHAVDYLLKPFDDDRFEDALERALETLRSRRLREVHDRLRELLAEVAGATEDEGEPREAGRYLERFAVPERGRLTVVPAGDVDWIEADGDYVKLHAGGDSHLLRGTMTALEDRLDPERFARIHRSAIVQLDRIEELRSDEHGDYRVVLADGRRLRVSRTYRPAVLRRMGLAW